MLLKEVLVPDVIEYLYNYDYMYNPKESNIDQNVAMTPFVYNDDNGRKRLVIIWEAILKDKSTSEDILNFKLECGYLLDCTEKNNEGFERFKKLLEITCGIFSIYYDYLAITHLVRLKNIKDYYVGLEHHFQTISPLLYD